MKRAAADRELFARLARSDPGALSHLIDKHWGSLVRYAAGLLPPGEAPEDAVQEAFVRLWERRARWTPSGSLSGLLHRLVRNRALDLRRARRHSGPVEDDVPDDAPSPLDDAHAAELARLVRRAVSQLPPRRREVYGLARESGLTYDEIAHVMDVSPQTVANQMSMALADLRLALRPYVEPTDDGRASRSSDRAD